MRRILRKASPILGLVILVLVVRSVGGREILSIVSAADPLVLGLAATALTAHFAAKALRWRGILGAIDARIPVVDAVTAYGAGAMLGAVTPGRVGEVVKVLMVKRHYPVFSWSSGLGSIVVDRLIDIALLGGVFLCGVFFVVSRSDPTEVEVPTGAITLVLAMCFGFVVVVIWGMKKVNSMDYRFLPAKIREVLSEVTRLTESLRWQAVVRMAVWTILAYALFFVHFVLIARSLECALSPFELSWAISAASLAAIVPISIAGVGVRDIVLVQAFSLFGGKGEAALAVSISLVYLAVFSGVVVVIGLWPFLTQGIDIGDVRRHHGDNLGDRRNRIHR